MDTKKLRQKILDLAIHGKLVPQDSNDEPASVFLERIRAEKERLISEGKIKRSRKTVKTSDTLHYEQDVPFEVPQGWVWCKLDDLAFYKKGPFGSSLTKSMFVLKGDNTYKVYEQKNAIQKNEKLGTYYISKEKYQELIAFAIQPFDIIVSCAGTIGETFVLPQEPIEGIINQALMLVRLYNRDIEKFYLLYFDYILKEEAYKESKGTAIKNIPPFDVLKNFYIPLPPFSEQQRIVAEIERWFALIDTIEQGKVELQTAIKQTKSKILDLAIHGKLVPQDPSDEPAIELVRRINPKAQITCDNEHSEKLPKGWYLSTLGDCFKWGSGGTPESTVKAYYEGNIPWLVIGDLNDSIVTFASKHISQLGIYNSSAKVLTKGTLLMAMYGSIGKLGIAGMELATNQAIAYAKPNEINTYYLFYYLIANRDNFYMLGKGGTQKNISQTLIKSYPFLLPPLAEQKRIVLKIEELFSIIDTVEQTLQA